MNMAAASCCSLVLLPMTARPVPPVGTNWPWGPPGSTPVPMGNFALAVTMPTAPAEAMVQGASPPAKSTAVSPLAAATFAILESKTRPRA